MLSIEKLKVLCDLTGQSSDYILFGRNIYAIEKVQKLLSNYTEEQLSAGISAIQTLALFIKKE